MSLASCLCSTPHPVKSGLLRYLHIRKHLFKSLQPLIIGFHKNVSRAYGTGGQSDAYANAVHPRFESIEQRISIVVVKYHWCSASCRTRTYLPRRPIRWFVDAELFYRQIALSWLNCCLVGFEPKSQVAVSSFQSGILLRFTLPELESGELP